MVLMRCCTTQLSDMAYLLPNISASAFTPNKKAPTAARAMTIPLSNCDSSLLKV